MKINLATVCKDIITDMNCQFFFKKEYMTSSFLKRAYKRYITVHKYEFWKKYFIIMKTAKGVLQLC